MGGDRASWAISSSGSLVHEDRPHGPRLRTKLATGDRVRAVYRHEAATLRFGVNGAMLGARFTGVVGPVVPAISASGHTKAVVELCEYWSY